MAAAKELGIAVTATVLPRLDNSLFPEALPFMACLLWTSTPSLGPSV